MLDRVEVGSEEQKYSGIKSLGQKVTGAAIFGAAASASFFGTRWLGKTIAGWVAGATHEEDECDEDESELEEVVSEIKRKQKSTGVS